MGKVINPATGKPFVQVAPNSHLQEMRTQIIRQLRNRYDAAQTTSQNELHWRHADALSPHSANNPAVRLKLRNRSRYEVSNNGYLKGILLTLANDFVASGPKVQITDKRFSDEQRTILEASYEKYCEKIKLRKKLWRMRFAKCQDGETFGFAFLNRNLKNPIKRDYRLFEADQVSSWDTAILKKGKPKFIEIDGIRFDRASGEPTEYFLRKEHPGEAEYAINDPSDGSWVSATNTIHWFRQERGWLRGIPETTPTLPLWALLRRYTLAVVQNAEIAADFTVLLKSMQSANTTPFSLSGGEPSTQDPNDWFDSFPVDRGLMTVLPSHYDLTQLDPKQPVTVYDTFVQALVQEACRCLLTPKNVALGNSGGYNMASGTLDRQCYRQAIENERFDCNTEVLEPIFDAWWYEAVRIPGYFDDDYATTSPIYEVIRRYPSLKESGPERHHRWDEVPEHTDPVKVATAIDILHAGGHISDVDVQELRFNRSVEEHYANLERQITWRDKWMPTEVPLPPGNFAGNKMPEPEKEDEEDDMED